MRIPKWILVIGGLMVAGFVFGEIRGPQPKKAADPSYSPEVVEVAVKQLLRDPDSATFGPMSMYARQFNGRPVTAVCGSVNAKNGFGGYAGSADFVFVKESTAVFMRSIHGAEFVRAWNVLCAGKGG